jgi:type IV secretory pathway TraG/TraD family ATPase VirD4
MLQSILEWLVTTAYVALPLAFAGLLFSTVFLGLSPLKMNERMNSMDVLLLIARRTSLIGLAVSIVWGGMVFFLVQSGYSSIDPYFWDQWIATWPAFIISTFLLALMLNFICQRYVLPYISKWRRDFRKNQSDEDISDIKDTIQAYQNSLDYVPEHYFKDGQFFLGMQAGDTSQIPVYMNDNDFVKTHKSIVGATRYGKGVTFQIIAQQHIRNGDNLIFIDPKGDDFIPEILKRESEKAGKKFLFINLKDDEAKGAYQPFIGGDKKDQFSRFCEIMGLVERGTDADHYKVLSRGAFNEIFNALDHPPRLNSIIQQMENFKDDEQIYSAMSTVRVKLQEWQSRPSLNPGKSRSMFSIERALKEDTVIYVLGSLDDQIIKQGTRCMIIEILQEAKRLKNERKNHCAIFIDELRYLVNETVMSGLATIAGANCSLSLAFQNFGDLLNPDDITLDGRGIEQTVKVNCQVKMTFGGTDALTAKYISENSGTTVKQVTRMETTKINVSGGETFDDARTLNKVEEALVTANEVLSLPPLTGILFRPYELAIPVKVSPVPLSSLDT